MHQKREKLKMPHPLRILHLEDNHLDAELVAAALESAGLKCSITRVDTEQAFKTILGHGGIDIILADYSLPSFDGLSALKLAHEKCPDIPYIFVSGQMGEDIAVESLKLGATDYILKNNLSRLVPSVRRALNEAHDRRERKRAEEKTTAAEKALWESEARMQKLESLRALAGGIAHDLNNLMVAVDANAGLALKALPPDSPARDLIEGIEKAVAKVSTFSKQIMSFTGKFEAIKEPVDLNEMVEDTSHFLLASISKDASLEFHLSDGLPTIMADPQNIQQVVMNLILNASDALEKSKGRIEVCTGKLHAERPYLDSLHLGKDLAEGEYLFIEVSDTGCGMDEETKGRVFDPFYTTKFTGRGLGLSAVFGIVKGHGGAIGLKSGRGRGTTFKVLFPIQGEPLAAGVEKQEPADVWSGRGTILVVDDDESVRMLTRKVLETAGYSVLTAPDGRQGIEAVSQNGESISLVLIDLIMPQMRGDEAAKEMRNLKDGIKILFLSGYNDLQVSGVHGGPDKGEIMMKPYKVTKLLEKIQEVLGQNVNQ
jgi:two-component system cell cycle sensor histidine kinase/response regulator CckA